MSALIEPHEIEHETDIVCLEDIDTLDYVRQSLDRLPRRAGKPAYHRHGRLVGYAVLGPDAKASRASGAFLRRVMWLAPHDRDQDPDGLYATGAPPKPSTPAPSAPVSAGTRPTAPKAVHPPRPPADTPRGIAAARMRRPWTSDRSDRGTNSRAATRAWQASSVARREGRVAAYLRRSTQRALRNSD